MQMRSGTIGFRSLLIFFFSAITVFCTPTSTQALGFGFGNSFGISPYLDWKSIETKHFRINYPATMETIAEKSAQYFEEAYGLLNGRLYWDPDYRVEVTLADSTDLANGLTAPVLRLGMVLYPIPPEPGFSTNHYDDWLRLLILHEYTHFVNMDPTTDWMKLLRWVFGDVIRPNSIWPVWQLEGLAVYMETRLTQMGRGRSPYYEAILRAFVAQNRLDEIPGFTLDRVNGGPPYFPGGEAPYLFGYQLMNEVARDPTLKTIGQTADGLHPIENGEDALGILSLRSSHRIPFFINWNLENVTGKEWPEYWDQWVQFTKTRIQKQIAQIQKTPLSPIQALRDHTYQAKGMAFSKGGKWEALVYSAPDETERLMIRNTETGSEWSHSNRWFGPQLEFTPDQRFLIFAAIVPASLYDQYYDLFAVDTESKSIHRLTWGQRLRDPTVSPDGKTLAFVITEAGKTSLGIASLDLSGSKPHLGTIQTHFSPPLFDRIANPRFSQVDSKLYFSWKKNGQTGDGIHLLSQGTNTPTTIIADAYQNRFPSTDANGKLYFVSNRTGVDNLFQWDEKTGRARQRTNVLTTLSLPVFKPGEFKSVYAATIRADGWTPSRIDLAETELVSHDLTIDPPPAPPLDTDAQPHPPSLSEIETEKKTYSAWRTLAPRQWTPLLYVDDTRGYLGGQVAGFDALDLHQYALIGAYDSLIKKGDFIGYYANRSLGPQFTLVGESRTQLLQYLNGSASTLLSYTRLQNLEASVTRPFLFQRSALYPALSVRTQRTHTYIPSISDSDPAQSSRGIPSIDASLSYSDTEQSILSVGPEKGRRSSLAARTYFEGDTTSTRFFASHGEYFHFGNHWTLAPRLVASWSPQITPSTNSSVVIGGRNMDLVGSFSDQPTQDLNTLSVRGYPGRIFRTQSALLASGELRFPVWNIFRGISTHPFFLNQIYGFMYGESLYSPAAKTSLPSAGGGLRLTADVLIRVPLVLAVEYHRGFREDLGGQHDWFFKVLLGGIGF